MLASKNKQYREESLAILEKVMENNYQRKILKEMVERIVGKMANLLDTKFPDDDFRRLKDEFRLLKQSMNIIS
eukprot:jgi/Antlo1/1640/157